MTLMFNGLGVSPGVVIGPAHLLRRDQVDVAEHELSKKAVPAEVRRLKKALKDARAELKTARDTIPSDAPSDISAFIESHLLMLDDDMLSQRPIEIIRSRQINAEAALQQQREELAKVFASMEDSYIATRVDDVTHVINTILGALARDGKARSADNWKGQVVVADDLTPADTVLMQHQGVAGFVTESGGPLSHTAILARSLGIPALVGVSAARRYIRNGEMLLLDGGNGLLLAEPTPAMESEFRQRQKQQRQQQRELEKLIDTPTVSADGVKLVLAANIEIEEDLKAVRRFNAEGVGLYRTEFLYLGRDSVPDEQEHFKAYLRVIRALKGKPLTIRTADLGADKSLSTTALPSGPLAHNPAMGLRGIRLCLNETHILVPQLRAILRASAKGPVRILIPMVTTLSEVRQVRELLEQIKTQLSEDNIDFDPKVPLGAMIEVPAAAIAAHHFAAELDFLSIGTNDLIQYTLAIDRVDDQVNYLYDPLHPAVLMLIRQTIEAGARAGIPVSMCGEMAGDPLTARLLLGLGLTEFSMPPNRLLEVKKALLDSSRKALEKPASQLLDARTSEEQAAILERIHPEDARPN